MTTTPLIQEARSAPTALRPRHRKTAAVATSTVAAMLALTLPATGAAAPVRDKADPAGTKLQAIVDRVMSGPETPFPGVALRVHRPGHAAWTGAAGKADVKRGTPMRAGNRFRAGSIMKPFVAAATLQLVEDGRFRLDDRLPAVLPARTLKRFPQADRITVRMLLNHTSGLGRYDDGGFNNEVLANPRRRWTVAELLDRAAAQPRFAAPGVRHAYSNTNYNLLGLVLEHATGKPWRTVVRERVIDRLGLRHTSLPVPGHTPVGRDIARAYEHVDGGLRDVTDVDSSMAGAAGGHALLTTTADLSRFLDGLLEGKLFRHHRTLRQMRTFVAAPSPEGQVGYGLGLERYVFGGTEMVGHLGTTAGFRVVMGRLPAQRTTIVMVITTPDDPTPVLMPALQLLTGAAS
jgi:D-alanyl-D-alanine carboxypeptidase